MTDEMSGEMGGGWSTDVDPIAGYDQAQKRAIDALAGTRAFILVCINENEECETHACANATPEELNTLAWTTVRAAYQIKKMVEGTPETDAPPCPDCGADTGWCVEHQQWECTNGNCDRTEPVD